MEDKIDANADYDQKTAKIKSAMDKVLSKDEMKKRFGYHYLDDEPYGIVYGLYNLKSGRWYVGQTKTGVSASSGQLRRYPKGWIQDHWSNPYVRQDLVSFGWGSFSDMIVLSIAYSADELNAMEGYWMKRKDSLLNGYSTNVPITASNFAYGGRNKKK